MPDGGRPTTGDSRRGSCFLAGSPPSPVVRFPRRRQPVQQQRFEPFFVLKGEGDRQRAGVSGKLSRFVLAAKPRQILFRRYQYQPRAGGLLAQCLGLGPCVAVMVGEASPRGERNASIGKG